MAKRKKRAVKRRVNRVGTIQKTENSGARRFGLIIKNLVLFLVLSLGSILLHNLVTNEFLNNLFYVLAIVMGTVAFAFLILLMIFFALRLMRK
ncbi:MAG: hypothetical protein KKA64_03620 [Nanoarchaeota archaeon]|nr:hypothetical protein [Nanoarchaeota archaeon]